MENEEIIKEENKMLIEKTKKMMEAMNINKEKLKNHKYEILIEIYNKYGGHQFFEAKVVEDHGKIKILEIMHYEI